MKHGQLPCIERFRHYEHNLIGRLDRRGTARRKPPTRSASECKFCGQDTVIPVEFRRVCMNCNEDQ